VGELRTWDGFAPNIRIQAGDSLYGVGLADDGVMPDAARAAMTKQGKVQGSFRICPTGDQISIPTWNKLLPIVCVEAFAPRAP